MNSGHTPAIVLIMLAGCFAIAAFVVRERYATDSRHTVVRRAVAASIGMCSLALSREGSYARNPLEGPAAGLGDMPAGYCIHDDSDWVACPSAIGRPFIATIETAVP